MEGVIVVFNLGFCFFDRDVREGMGDNMRKNWGGKGRRKLNGGFWVMEREIE